jgi:hypothetical protein
LNLFTIFWISLTLIAFSAKAQNTVSDSLIVYSSPEDSAKVIVAAQDEIVPFHSPRKATIMSALLPGLGQTYNKKYWKIPIIYAGLGVSIYYLQDNLAKVKSYKQDYRYETDEDPNTINDSGYSASQLEDLAIQHKKWRDYSYLAISAIYLLNIIDANVDAHLFRFDVSEDLSLHVLPSLNLTAQPTASFTLCLKL